MGTMNFGFTQEKPIKLGQVEIPDVFYQRFGTGIDSIDRFFGDGGMTPGQVFTFSAPKGGGKTTALLQILQKMSSKKKVLYLSGEEYLPQLSFMARRLGAVDIDACNMTDICKILPMMSKYDVVIIDSLASISCSNPDELMPEIKDRPAQKEILCVNALYMEAKKTNCVVGIILHQTKSGMEKGSSSINHTVDTVLRIREMAEKEMEAFGLTTGNYKFIFTEKNRFGPVQEDLFRMSDKGWDFANPIFGGQSVPKKLGKNEMACVRLLEEIQKKPKFDQIDLQNYCADDFKLYNNCKWYLRDLCKMGKIEKKGHGKTAYWQAKVQVSQPSLMTTKEALQEIG